MSLVVDLVEPSQPASAAIQQSSHADSTFRLQLLYLLQSLLPLVRAQPFYQYRHGMMTRMVKRQMTTIREVAFSWAATNTLAYVDVQAHCVRA
jgi:hypothetical protein